MALDPKPLFPDASVRDIRIAAQACREAAKVGESKWRTHEAKTAVYLIEDLGRQVIIPGPTYTWSEIAATLEAEADRLERTTA